MLVRARPALALNSEHDSTRKVDVELTCSCGQGPHSPHILSLPGLEAGSAQGAVFVFAWGGAHPALTPGAAPFQRACPCAAPGHFIIPPLIPGARALRAGRGAWPLRVRPLRAPQPEAGYAVRPCPLRRGPCAVVLCACPALVPGLGRVSPAGFLPWLVFVFGLVGRGRRGRSCGLGVGSGVVRVPSCRSGGVGGRGGRGFGCGGSWSGSGSWRGAVSGRCRGCWRCRLSGCVVFRPCGEPVSAPRLEKKAVRSRTRVLDRHF